MRFCIGSFVVHLQFIEHSYQQKLSKSSCSFWSLEFCFSVNFVCVSQSVRALLYPNLCTQEEQKSIYLKLPQSCVKCFLVGDAMLNFWAIVRYRHRLADQSKSRLNRTQPCFGELTAAPSLNVMVFVKLSQRNELITNTDLDTDSYSSG